MVELYSFDLERFIAAAASSQTCLRRPQIARLAPSASSRSPIIRPSPVPPPVIRMRLPEELSRNLGDDD